MGTLADDYMAARLEADRPKRPRRVEDLPRKSDRSRQVRDDIYAMGNDGAPGPVLGRDYAIGAAAMTPAGVDTLWRMGGGNPSLTDNAQSRSLFEAARNRAPASDVPTLPEVQATARKPSLATRARAMGADAMAGGQEALQGLGSAAMSVGMGAARSTVDPTYLPRLAAPVLRAAVVDPALNAPRQMGEGGRTLREQGYELARPTLARAAGNTALAALTAADAPMLARGVAGLARGARAAPVAARAAEGAAVREAAPMANYADDAPTDGQPLFRVDPTPRPASGGNSGIAGLGLAAAGGALAAPDDARAQEVGGRQRADEELAAAQDKITALDQQINALSGFDASSPQSVAAIQRQIGARVDGRAGPETREAIRQRVADLTAQRAFAQSRIESLQKSAEEQRQADMLQRLSPTAEDEVKREALLAGSAIGSVLFAKYGIPVPRTLPVQRLGAPGRAVARAYANTIGKAAGMGGRAGNVYGVEQRLQRNMDAAAALKFPAVKTNSAGLRSVQDDIDATQRASVVNQYFTLGGAPPRRVPFKVGQGERPEIRRTSRIPGRRALEAPELFRPPRVNAGDMTAMVGSALETAGSTYQVEEAKKKVAAAEQRFANDKSEANYRMVLQARQELTMWEALQRAGGGYFVGRATSAFTRPGSKMLKPDYSQAQAEQGRIANYISRSGSGGVPPAAAPRLPPLTPVAAAPRVKAPPQIGSDAHIRDVAERARAAGFDIQKARKASGVYDAMILRAQIDPEFSAWLRANGGFTR